MDQQEEIAALEIKEWKADPHFAVLNIPAFPHPASLNLPFAQGFYLQIC